MVVINAGIKTVRNELVTIPNQTLLQNQIVNYSGMDLLATSVEVSITYQNNRLSKKHRRNNS
jgi:small-conductance mechanosensitive channel